MPDRSRVGPKLVHDGPPEESARPRHLPGPRPARSRHQRPPGSWRADAPAPRPPALDRFNPRIGPSHPHLTATRRVPVPRMRQSLTRHSNMRKILRWGYQGVSSTIRRSRTHPIPSEAGRHAAVQVYRVQPHLRAWHLPPGKSFLLGARPTGPPTSMLSQTPRACLTLGPARRGAGPSLWRAITSSRTRTCRDMKDDLHMPHTH